MGGSLGDQLLKMGLVDEKQVRQAQHEQRTSRKRKGRKAVESEKASRAEAARARRDDARREDRARSLAENEVAASHEGQNRVQQIVVSGRVEGRTNGRRRFYFEARDGRVPLLELSDELVDGLEAGRVAVAEGPDGRVTLIKRSAAERVDEIDGTWIRTWNR